MDDAYCLSLDRKLEAIEKATETNIELTRKMLLEFKRSNDAQEMHWKFIDKDMERMNKQIETSEERIKYLEGEIMRIGILEQAIKTSGSAPSGSPAPMDTWFDGKIAKIVFWGSAIVGGILLHRLTETLLK